MLARVEIAALLRLIELGSDRKCRTIPPESSEYVSRSGLLAKPAGRCDVRPASGQVETTFAFAGDRSVSLHTGRAGIAAVMPVLVVRSRRQGAGVGRRP